MLINRVFGAGNGGIIFTTIYIANEFGVEIALRGIQPCQLFAN